MSQATDYWEKKCIDSLLNKVAMGTITPFLALLTADPGETGSTANEISTSGTAYARQSISAAFPAATSGTGTSTNTSPISYPTATSDWGTITHAAIMDAVTGGNMLIVIPLQTAKLISTGDVFQFAASQLSVTCA